MVYRPDRAEQRFLELNKRASKIRRQRTTEALRKIQVKLGYADCNVPQVFLIESAALIIESLEFIE